MSIVPITEKDWQDLKNIRLESLRDSPDAFGITYKEAMEISEEKWKSIASGELGLKFFLARSEKENIGVVGAAQIDGKCELVSMWVKPEKRSDGVGVSLVKELLDYAKSNGFTSVVLSVSSRNEAAFNLYSKIGFKNLGEVGGSLGPGLKKMVWHFAPEP
ncbi:GNAT family N-acetyltransferase [Microbulbifer harenosus]|uniref:GNAT family N-acetyltransferase n=1 Tax=Microbulbifer harenosus TaxID=2576840 RepID=A0ABY2UCX6_9GAMM|nr:GNAT family N-acetyltransferase [Microbulbifer harenosus]TLM72533.1 GNAT family N-acetyltransferase [Microbulbifer harenosus]